jgi:hypothetical protein
MYSINIIKATLIFIILEILPSWLILYFIVSKIKIKQINI